MRALRTLRRASTIVAYWRAGQLIFTNYRTGVSITSNPVTGEILQAFETWCSVQNYLNGKPQYTPKSVIATLWQLVKATLLVERGSPEDQQDKAFNTAWAAWLPEAGLLHFATKDFPFLTSAAAARKLMQTYLKESAQPSFHKSYPRAKRFRLPAATKINALLPDAYPTVLFSRRTRRHFGASPLTLESLSTLLRYTWGIAEEINAFPLGRLPLRTSPSAGSRHPIEAYVIPLRVTGLAPAIYHYHWKHHFLEKIGSLSSPKMVIEYCAGQHWFGDAGALFIMTAVFPRVAWKYRFSRAYRAVLLDAGHLCQTFCLTATWLGLGALCTIALKDSLIERQLGLDGVTESVIYACGVGCLDDRGKEPLNTRAARIL